MTATLKTSWSPGSTPNKSRTPFATPIPRHSAGDPCPSRSALDCCSPLPLSHSLDISSLASTQNSATQLQTPRDQQLKNSSCRSGPSAQPAKADFYGLCLAQPLDLTPSNAFSHKRKIFPNNQNQPNSDRLAAFRLQPGFPLCSGIFREKKPVIPHFPRIPPKKISRFSSSRKKTRTGAFRHRERTKWLNAARQSASAPAIIPFRRPASVVKSFLTI
jgi:hypothetical protein